MEENIQTQSQEQGASPCPCVSVLVPIYNVERYLRQCLDSLRAQSMGDFEVICINDGSTDGSREIIQEYLDCDDRFMVLDKENSGYGSSMNQGLSMAQGKYVAILESDDFFSDDALEKLVSAAESHGAQVAKANFDLYWSVPSEQRELFEIVDDGMSGRAYAPITEPSIFYKKPSIWSAVYRKDFLDVNGIRFLETPGASYQDASFNFKVWACADCAAFIADSVLSYRQDNEKSSVNSPSKVYCVCDEYAEMQRFLDAHPEKKASLQGILERMKFDTYMWNYDRLGTDLKADFLERAAAEFRTDLADGKVNLSLFEVWAEADLRALLDDPKVFEECRAKYAQAGKLNTFKHYYRLGGMPLVAKLLAAKFTKGK